tara:strand:+ start:1700 stop:1852 length:153 start_codon:yes stop_codon:yes gene_type:complete
MTYGMCTKTGDILIKTENANNIEEAIEYFSKIKQLPREDFLKVFIVTEIK